MGNWNENIISVVGLKESPEIFLKKLSKVMFDYPDLNLDLDDLDPTKFGCSKKEADQDCNEYYLPIKRRVSEGTLDEVEVSRVVVTRKTLYSAMVEHHCVPDYFLSIFKPVIKFGVSIPRFHVATHPTNIVEQIKKASEAFPNLFFHLHSFLEQDGPTWEFVIKGGKVHKWLEVSQAWYLFDQLKDPYLSLLPDCMGLSLTQRGQLAIETAIDFVKQIHRVIHDPRFVYSPYQPFRDPLKFKETTDTLDALLAYMEETAKSLTFEGVIISDEKEEGLRPFDEEEIPLTKEEEKEQEKWFEALTGEEIKQYDVEGL